MIDELLKAQQALAKARKDMPEISAESALIGDAMADIVTVIKILEQRSANKGK